MIALHGRTVGASDGISLWRRVWKLVAGTPQAPWEAAVETTGQPTNTTRIRFGASAAGSAALQHWVDLPPELTYLGPEDVIAASPDGRRVRVLYRARGRQNAVLLTERCDNYCLMCSQPPKSRLDDHLLEDALGLVPLIDDPATGLCFTGGEPTLYGERFIDLLRLCRAHLPTSQIHILSNGRRFADAGFARSYAAVDHPGVMVGIPLYGAEAGNHDYVVQANGAFSETITGLLRLGELRQRIEIRVVIHRQTVPEFVEIARFIARNLPFVDQVALMGLEMTGFARANADLLWADPAGYRQELREAVLTLHHAGVPVLIYNHQHCVIDRDLWPFAVPSISDWKNEFVEECRHCDVRTACCGFFSTSGGRRSAHVRPVTLGADGDWGKLGLTVAGQPRTASPSGSSADRPR